MSTSRGLQDIINDIIPQELFDNHCIGDIKWNTTNTFLFMYSINNSATALALIDCLELKNHSTPLKPLLIKTVFGLYVITLGRNLPDLENKLKALSAENKDELTKKIRSEFITQSPKRVIKLAEQIKARLPQNMDLQSALAKAYTAVSYKISPVPTTVDQVLELNDKMDELANAYRQYAAEQVNSTNPVKPSMM